MSKRDPREARPICPHCGNGKGIYKKGWDMKKKQQKKGGVSGETEDTDKVLRIFLYKCDYCRKLFRKGRVETCP